VAANQVDEGVLLMHDAFIQTQPVSQLSRI